MVVVVLVVVPLGLLAAAAAARGVLMVVVVAAGSGWCRKKKSAAAPQKWQLAGRLRRLRQALAAAGESALDVSNGPWPTTCCCKTRLQMVLASCFWGGQGRLNQAVTAALGVDVDKPLWGRDGLTGKDGTCEGSVPGSFM